MVDDDPGDPEPGATPTPCSTPGAMPQGKVEAWPQNASVSVVIQTGTGHFTAAQAACLTTAFSNWNTANVASGNASGVRFNVTTSTTAVGTMSPSGSNPSTGGQNNVYQVSRGTPSSPMAAAITNGLGNNDNTGRGNAVTLIHPEVGTDVSNGCAALTRTMAHEIGHTMGINHCQPGTGTCNQTGTSVMNQLPCGVWDQDGVCLQPAYDDVTRGRPGPSTCDNNKVKQVGEYNPATTNQPAPPSTGGTGGGTGGGTPPNWATMQCQAQGFFGAPNYQNTWGGCGSGLVSFQSGTGTCCGYWTPVIIDADGDGFDLTDAYDGVRFDAAGSGYPDQVAWTASGSDDSWLVLDRNGNGLVDSGVELFGNATPQSPSATPNGFLALAIFDAPENGGNSDGVIDEADAIFRWLRLWQDVNHNGVSERAELFRLPALDVVSINLDYKESRRVDKHGNRFVYRSKVRDARGAKVGRWAWDVFPVANPPPR